MPEIDHRSGGLGDDLSRSELALIRSAIRQDWPIPPAVKAQIMQRLIDYLDRDHDEGKTCSDRQVVMAARTLVQFCALGLEQQKVDIARDKLEGKQARGKLEDLVEEAERRANERLAQRHSGTAD